jgi:ATP-binding cassette subfamily F protein uup
VALLGIHKVTHSLGGPPLLEGAELHIEEGDRLCLLGRNGAGKSTLMQLMAGHAEPEAGRISRSVGMSTAYLGQWIPEGLSGPALDTAADGREERTLEAEQLLTLFGIDPAGDLAAFSGGEKRRVLLARALAAQADLLLLDEPTNHLDIDTVEQLEEYLLRRVKTLVFVTHDRAFARRLANRFAELDRGSVYAARIDYDRFLEEREQRLAAEERRRELFDKRLAEEESWLRKGLKARQRRNEGRVRRLEQMREEYRQRRERAGSVSMEIHDGGRSGKLVAEARHLSFGYGETPLIRDFSTRVLRGDRVGVVGPNGAGKTTLLKLLLGELTPDAGNVRLGSNLRPIYFDQLRSELDPERSVAENLGEGADTIVINGRRRHLMSYLQDFLFPPERARMPVAHLSGGERNRLLLAKLFARPANLLVLDEPTNDLDIETLELLEQLLLDFEGTILLVSHDREFLDNVVTDCFVLDGSGAVIEYAGGYGDWWEREAQRRARAAAGGQEKSDKSSRNPGREGQSSGEKGTKTQKPRSERPRKLTFREKSELQALPEKIEALEEEQDRLQQRLADPGFYRSEEAGVSEAVTRLSEVEEELSAAYARWEFLESLPE